MDNLAYAPGVKDLDQPNGIGLQTRNRDLLFGYSPNLNKWVKQPTEISKTNSVPKLGESVAIVRLDLPTSRTTS